MFSKLFLLLSAFLLVFSFMLGQNQFDLLNTMNEFKKSMYFTSSIITGSDFNNCNISDFTGNSYSGGCYTVNNKDMFIPYNTGLSFHMTGQKIIDGKIINWFFGEYGCLYLNGTGSSNFKLKNYDC